MIFINRNKVPKPKVLEDKSDEEHKDAHEHYVTNAKTNAFDHKLFKDTEVKKALEKLFNGKCAYCESNVVTTSAIDKEHFRPKTSIKDKETKDTKRGYYWLAAEWDNLLLACGHCNRTGTHKDFYGKDFVSGKLDYFPLSDENKRAKYGEELGEEEKVRLLLNPCIDNPEKLIVYNKEGEILSKEGNTDKENKMVNTSISIYGLERSNLHKRRAEKWLSIQNRILNIKSFYGKYLKYQDDDFIDMIKNELDELKKFKSEDQEYLGVARYVIRKELNELKVILRGL